MTVDRSRPAGLLAPGLLLGAGIAGFVDGIVLHQVLQWHHLLSSTGSDRLGVDPQPTDTVAGLEVNTLWDGLFHLLSLAAVLAGLVLLHRRTAHRPSDGRSLLGPVLIGAGSFNVVEGLVDHHLLGVHHVRDPDQVADVLPWDLGFLAIGAALAVAGVLVHRARLRTLEAEPGPRVP